MKKIPLKLAHSELEVLDALLGMLIRIYSKHKKGFETQMLQMAVIMEFYPKINSRLLFKKTMHRISLNVSQAIAIRDLFQKSITSATGYTEIVRIGIICTLDKALA